MQRKSMTAKTGTKRNLAKHKTPKKKKSLTFFGNFDAFVPHYQQEEKRRSYIQYKIL